VAFYLLLRKCNACTVFLKDHRPKDVHVGMKQALIRNNNYYKLQRLCVDTLCRYKIKLNDEEERYQDRGDKD